MMFLHSVTLFVLLTYASAVDHAPVNIGTAGEFAILTKSAITTTGTNKVTGD
jgi:hypothetical protein